MNDLKELFLRIGFVDVKTILATGNIIISIDEAMRNINLKEYIETELRKTFSYDAHVIIRSLGDIEEICKEASKIPISDDYHLYVLLFDSDQVTKEVEILFNTIESNSERLITLQKDMLWIVEKGDTLKSEFGSKILGNKKYKDKLTSRNFNTIKKMI